MTNMKLWAGYQYEPTPLPTDMNGSHYLDADRHIFGLGAGTSFKDPWGLLFKPMELSAAIQEKYLPKKTFESAGTSYSLKGNVISGMLSIKFHYSGWRNPVSRIAAQEEVMNHLSLIMELYFHFVHDKIRCSSSIFIHTIIIFIAILIF